MPSTAGWWLIGGALALGYVLLTNSLLGPPQIFADEYAYSATAAAMKSGQWTGLRDTIYQEYPNRLFFAVYGVAAAAKDVFAAARSLNALWLAVGFAVLYAVARGGRVLVAALPVALAYVLGPSGTSTAYFMPETLFATTFMAAGALVAATLAGPGWLTPAGAGAALAALPYIKPNGWMVVAAALLVMAGFLAAQPRSERSRVARQMLVMVAGLVAAWLVLRTVLPDTPGRGRFLGMYSGVGGNILALIDSPSRYGLVVELVLVHLLIVGCLAGPAFVYAVQAFVRPRVAFALSHAESFTRSLAGLAGFTLLALVIMTAVFTAAMAGTSLTDTADRLHLRYYSFVLPLLIVGFAGAPVGREWSTRRATVIAAIWMLVALVALVVLPRYHWTIIDAPDLFVGEGYPKAVLPIFTLLGACAAIALRRRANASIIGVAICFVTAAVFAGYAARNVQTGWQPLPEDRAGTVAAALAEQAGVPIVVLANLNEGAQWPYRIASYAPGRSRLVRPDALRALVAQGLPAGTILVAREAAMPARGVLPIGRFGDLSVGRLADPVAAVGVVLRDGALPPGEVFDVPFGGTASSDVEFAGMHAREAWGAWSAAPKLSIKLPFLIRGTVRLALQGRALGSNVGRMLTLRIGAASQPFTLGGLETSVDLLLAVPVGSDTIEIDGYEQFPAAALGYPRDRRQLGIGLTTLRISTQ